MVVVYLGLGSNLHDRLGNIQNAIKLLNQSNIVVKTISPIYETEPVGKISIAGLSCPFLSNTNKFLNCVIQAQTTFEPTQLLSIIQSIEKSLGRKRRKWLRNTPRTIDIDILFYADKIINRPMLKIPHPELQHRAFVLMPLSDITPDFRHPVLNITIKELATKIDSKGVQIWKKQISLMPV